MIEKNNQDNISQIEYTFLLNEILKYANIEDKEISFLDIFYYLDRINKKNLMKPICFDIKNLGFEIIINKTTFESNSQLNEHK
ncbi:MAG: hypothetical protein WC867_01210 [Candidatus Pacearchaeota archaeon]|jgi:hypothetical protein